MMRLLRVVVTVALLGVLLWQVEGIDKLVTVLGRMGLMAILLLLLLNTMDRSLMTYKWLRLLASQGLRLRFLTAMKIYCASMVWGLFLPSTMGGDAVRAVCAARAGLRSAEVVASIIVERMIGILATSLVALGGLMLFWWTGALEGRLASAWWLSVALLFATLVLFWMSLSENMFNLIFDRLLSPIRNSRIIAKLRQFHSVYRRYSKARPDLFIFFALTLAEQGLTISLFWVAAWGMAVDASLVYVTAAVPVAYLVSRFPVSVSGIGVFEGVFVLMMAAGGIKTENALAIALVGRGLQIVCWLPWWVAYVAGSGTVRRPATPIGASGLG